MIAALIEVVLGASGLVGWLLKCVGESTLLGPGCQRAGGLAAQVCR